MRVADFKDFDPGDFGKVWTTAGQHGQMGMVGFKNKPEGVVKINRELPLPVALEGMKSGRGDMGNFSQMGGGIQF